MPQQQPQQRTAPKRSTPAVHTAHQDRGFAPGRRSPQLNAQHTYTASRCGVRANVWFEDDCRLPYPHRSPKERVCSPVRGAGRIDWARLVDRSLAHARFRPGPLRATLAKVEKQHGDMPCLRRAGLEILETRALSVKR